MKIKLFNLAKNRTMIKAFKYHNQRFFFFLIILFFYTINLYSQFDSVKLIISGKVSDEQNHPVRDVSIIDINSRKTITTNKNGNFLIRIPRKITVFKFSHIGYKTKRLNISKKNLAKDTLRFNIMLETDVYLLKPIDIYSEKVTPAYDNFKANIYDYEFIGDNILLYLFENQKRILRVVDNSGVKKSEYIIPFEFNEFYKDCFGNIQLIGQDSVCQIFIDSTFHLIEKTDIEKFTKLLKTCVISTNENLIFQKYIYYNQYLLYYMVNKTSKNKKTIAVIHDEKGEGLFMQHYEEVKKYISLLANDDNYSPPEMRENDYMEMKYSNYLFREINFFNQVIALPVYSPIYLVTDTLYLFDHLNNCLSVFNKEGEFLRKYDITYNKQNGWAKELIADFDNEKIFAKFEDGYGLTTLKQIDFHNGKIIKEFNLAVHRFPMNIKIKGNFVYYISENPKEFSLDYLYKQTLEE